MSFDQRRRDELETRGYTVFPSVYPSTLVERLRVAIDEKALQRPDALASYEANPFQGIFALSNIGPIGGRIDPAVPELLSWAGARAALNSCGVRDPRFSSGFSISKPPGAPALYWHRGAPQLSGWSCPRPPTREPCSLRSCDSRQCACLADWHYWDSPESTRKMGIQMFLMLYLVDTSPANGCLRVLPGSHLQRVPLDVQHPGGHARWGEDLETDKALPETVAAAVAQQPGAVDVDVKAGDLVIGDSRLYHAARANGSEARRTCITMWYVDWESCGPGLRQAYGSHGPHGGEPCGIPVSTPEEAAMLEPLHMAYDPAVDGAGEEEALSSRAMGDWARTGEDSRSITTEDTFYFSQSYAKAKANLLGAKPRL
jgi:hypothetical protein